MTVTALTTKIRALLEFEIGEVEVEGEISNYRRQQSGHHYFTLKDAHAQLACVLFRGNAARLGKNLNLENGKAIVCKGEISVYEARGSYQLIIETIADAGKGQLQAQFEALKQKLQQEGLFATEKKLPLPSFVHHVGLITSPSGAALQDFLQVLQRRSPWIQIHLAGTPVQGTHAAPKITAALKELNQRSGKDLPALDAIVLCRGGGSLEDLFAFNDEHLARTIAQSTIPTINAVGHETDFTIADFVADLRAPTPSAAAELLSPDQKELHKNLQYLQNKLTRPLQTRIRHAKTLLNRSSATSLQRILQRKIQTSALDLDRVAHSLSRLQNQQIQQQKRQLYQLEQRQKNVHPQAILSRQTQKLSNQAQVLKRLFTTQLAQEKTKLKHQASLLQNLSPQAVLQRGYSLTLLEDGSIVSDPQQIPANTLLQTKLAKGTLLSKSCPPDQANLGKKSPHTKGTKKPEK